jgi:TM2 domain-containing membrane protein YozV
MCIFSHSAGVEPGLAAVRVPPQAVTVIVARPPALKSVLEAYLLWFPLGIIGLHHFYLRRYAFGVLYFFTLGVFGVGWLIDGMRMPCLVKEANRKIQRGAGIPRPGDSSGDGDDDAAVSLMDAYIMWFPLGLIGK